MIFESIPNFIATTVEEVKDNLYFVSTLGEKIDDKTKIPVVGFPFGIANPDAKIVEAKRLVDIGFKKIAILINTLNVKQNDVEAVKNEIEKLTEFKLADLILLVPEDFNELPENIESVKFLRWNNEGIKEELQILDVPSILVIDLNNLTYEFMNFNSLNEEILENVYKNQDVVLYTGLLQDKYSNFTNNITLIARNKLTGVADYLDLDSKIGPILRKLNIVAVWIKGAANTLQKIILNGTKVEFVSANDIYQNTTFELLSKLDDSYHWLFVSKAAALKFDNALIFSSKGKDLIDYDGVGLALNLVEKNLLAIGVKDINFQTVSKIEEIDSYLTEDFFTKFSVYSQYSILEALIEKDLLKKNIDVDFSSLREIFENRQVFSCKDCAVSCKGKIVWNGLTYPVIKWHDIYSLSAFLGNDNLLQVLGVINFCLDQGFCPTQWAVSLKMWIEHTGISNSSDFIENVIKRFLESNDLEAKILCSGVLNTATILGVTQDWSFMKRGVGLEPFDFDKFPIYEVVVNAVWQFPSIKNANILVFILNEGFGKLEKDDYAKSLELVRTSIFVKAVRQHLGLCKVADFVLSKNAKILEKLVEIGRVDLKDFIKDVREDLKLQLDLAKKYSYYNLYPNNLKVFKGKEEEIANISVF